MPDPTSRSTTTPGPGARRRSGPRPGQTASRKKILDAARVAFAANGYADTSMRGVAREAGVDPSLIVHFFGTKAGLFSAVVEWPYDGTKVAREIQEVPVEEVGLYAARNFMNNWEQDEHRSPVLSLLRAALVDQTAAALLREFTTVNFALPMVNRVGSDQPELRAALVAAQLMGFGLARYAIGFEALLAAPDEQLIAALGATIQHTCSDPLAST
jgi:AcrR family transcriptional regulator